MPKDHHIEQRRGGMKHLNLVKTQRGIRIAQQNVGRRWGNPVSKTGAEVGTPLVKKRKKMVLHREWGALSENRGSCQKQVL